MSNTYFELRDTDRHELSVTAFVGKDELVGTQLTVGNGINFVCVKLTRGDRIRLAAALLSRCDVSATEG